MSDAFENPEAQTETRRWSGEEGARRLFAAVRGACGQEEDLPARLEAGLRSALGLLAAEPGLAHTLTVAPFLGLEHGAFEALEDWIARFARLLGDAAASGPGGAVRDDAFLTEFLIAGVRFQIGLRVVAGEGAELLALLPGSLEVLLAYFLEPGEARRLARAALTAHE